MAEAIDVARLGRQVHKKRTNEGLSLRELAEITELKVPTLSRIERGDSKEIESSTLLALCRWLEIDPKSLRNHKPTPVTDAGKIAEETPDIVDVYLRADRNLDQNTAQSLSTLFRTAYEMALKKAQND